MSTQLKKIPSNLWVVSVGSNSFQDISYAGKPQVVSRYILSNLWVGLTKTTLNVEMSMDNLDVCG